MDVALVFPLIEMIKNLTFNFGYLDKRNTVTAWSGYDSEELWQKHISDSVTNYRLKRHGWLPFVEIEYRYNAHGFRDEEFDTRPCGIALGCSFTEGVGVREQDSWPRKLEVLMGYKVWNLGIGGVGIDTCFRAMQFWAPLLRPRFIAMLDPPIPRIEICRADGGYTHLLNVGWQHSDATSPQDQFIRHWFSQDTNWIARHRCHVLAMRQWAQDHNILFVHLYHGPINQPDPEWQSSPLLFSGPDRTPLDLARDLGHVGPKTLEKTAEIMHRSLDKIMSS